MLIVLARHLLRCPYPIGEVRFQSASDGRVVGISRSTRST